MHELSIVQSVVTTVTEAMAVQPHVRIERVRLRIGALSGVVEGALQFGYGIATEGTRLEGSVLEVVTQPVVIYCATCDKLTELPGIQSFRCAQCNQPSADIRQGREMDIESLVIEEIA